MQVLIAVVDDLFQFVCKAFSGEVPYSSRSTKTSAASTDTKQVNSYQQVLQKIQGASKETLKTFTKKHPDEPKSTQSELLRAGEQYFIGVIGTYFYQDPVIAFDSALRRLEYGKSVRMVSLQGRWAQVRLAGIVGWVFKDALVLRIDDVYPRFVSGVQYTAEHPDTVKLRACIDDEFGGARGDSSLSPAEHVHYCLLQKNRIINWGDIRMRIPGTWQRKLRGCIGIHMGITPKTESVMEYVMDDVGHLAFVEAVFPDDSIKISEIGKLDDNAYTQGILQPEQWKELGPVFIDIQ